MARIVLDASVLIALLNSKDTHHRWALDFLVNASADEFLMPAINYAEALVHPVRAGLVEEFTNNIQKLGIQIVDSTASDAIQLANLRVATRLRMPDAIVLQTAIRTSAELATTDEKLTAAATENRIGVFSPFMKPRSEGHPTA
jgi:predicted nucleic acid-binding protein